MATEGWRLPETAHGWVTDGGLETDLIFHGGFDLPDFASFPLLDDAVGRTVLDDYYRGLTDELTTEALVVGAMGPRGDGYQAGDLDADRYADYHRPQLAAFADAGADLATAYTLTTVAEAVGVVRAARDVGLPVAVSYTVEIDGRLPDGTSLGDAVERLDEATGRGAAHLLVNCAHPDHVRPGLDADAAWLGRIAGLRVNSSRQSHAELDEAEELDEGDLPDLARLTRELADSLPDVRIVGGCCGTDVRHVAAMWDGWSPVSGIAT